MPIPDMTRAQALDAARRVRGHAHPTMGEEAAVALAVDLIATEEVITDAVATWNQHRDNPHIPPELRRAMDALAQKRMAR